jgi:hypothetical protein
VPGEQILDLLREDVFTTGNDHLVVASLNEKPSFFVQVTHITCRYETVEALLVLAARVPLEQTPAGDKDAAGLSLRNLRLSSSSSFTTVPRAGLPAVSGTARRSCGVATDTSATSGEP